MMFIRKEYLYQLAGLYGLKVREDLGLLCGQATIVFSKIYLLSVKNHSPAMLQKIHFPLPEDSLEYLKSPIASPWILVMLMLGILYERFNNLYYSSAVAIYALLTGFLALWFKLPAGFFM